MTAGLDGPMGAVAMNPGLAALQLAIHWQLLEDPDGKYVDMVNVAEVVKVQPPDGMVVRLRDGSRYCVTVHRCGP